MRNIRFSAKLTFTPMLCARLPKQVPERNPYTCYRCTLRFPGMWPNPGQHDPFPAEVGSTALEYCQLLSSFGQCQQQLIGPGRIGTNFGKIWVGSDQICASFERIRPSMTLSLAVPTSAKLRRNSDRHRPNLAGISPTLLKLGPNFAEPTFDICASISTPPGKAEQ